MSRLYQGYIIRNKHLSIRTWLSFLVPRESAVREGPVERRTTARFRSSLSRSIFSIFPRVIGDGRDREEAFKLVNVSLLLRDRYISSENKTLRHRNRATSCARATSPVSRSIVFVSGEANSTRSYSSMSSGFFTIPKCFAGVVASA